MAKRKGNYIEPSTEGYKANSPDRGNPYNVIPSGQITMQDVPHPVLGIDEFGNQQHMMPGGEYTFPGQRVLEIPIRQEGGDVITEHGWDYSKQGDNYLTRRSGTDNWITAKGNALNAIKQDVYQETPTIVPNPDMISVPVQDEPQNSTGTSWGAGVDTGGFLPVLRGYGEENCSKEGCSSNTSMKLNSLIAGNLEGEVNLWAQDAWFNKDRMLQDDGSLVYNTDVRDYDQMPSVPKEVYGTLQVGDYVHLNRVDSPSSKKYAAKTKDGLTNENIEHMGFVIGKDEDGTPLVWHGSESGQAYVQRLDEQLSLKDEKLNYKVSSIVRNPAMKNLNDEAKEKIKNQAYYSPFDKNLKLTVREGYTTEGQKEGVNAVNNNMQNFKDFNYNQRDVARIGELLVGGIMQNESGGDESDYRTWVKQPGAYIAKDVFGVKKAFEGDQASWGVYQMKSDYNFRNKDGTLNAKGKRLEELGVGIDNIFDSIENQTIAGTLILLDNLEDLRKDPNYDSETRTIKGMPESYVLAKSWQSGSGWQGREKYAKWIDNMDVTYSENALRNSSQTIGIDGMPSSHEDYTTVQLAKHDSAIDRQIASGALPPDYKQVQGEKQARIEQGIADNPNAHRFEPIVQEPVVANTLAVALPNVVPLTEPVSNNTVTGTRNNKSISSKIQSGRAGTTGARDIRNGNVAYSGVLGPTVTVRPKKQTGGSTRRGNYKEGGGTEDPEMINKDNYNTELTPEEKLEYDKWVVQENKTQGRDILMDQGAYDVQGFWKSGAYKNTDSDGHGTDVYKKPNHPTFSNESMYASDDNVAGIWGEDGSYYAPNSHKSLYGNDYYNKIFGDEPNRPEHFAGYMAPMTTVTPNFTNKKYGGNMAYMKNRFMQLGGPEINPYAITNPEMLKNQNTGPFYSTDKDYSSMLSNQRRDPNTWGNPATDQELNNMQNNMFATNQPGQTNSNINIYPPNQDANILQPMMNQQNKQYNQILYNQEIDRMQQATRDNGYTGPTNKQMGGGNQRQAASNIRPRIDNRYEGGNRQVVDNRYEGANIGMTPSVYEDANYRYDGANTGMTEAEFYRMNASQNKRMGGDFAAGVQDYFSKMAKQRKKALGGSTALMNQDVNDIIGNRKNQFTSYIQGQVGLNMNEQVDQEAQDAIIAGYDAVMAVGGNINNPYLDQYQDQFMQQQNGMGQFLGASTQMMLNRTPSHIKTKIKGPMGNYKFNQAYDPNTWQMNAKYGGNGLPMHQTNGVVGDEDITSSFIYPGEPGYVYGDGRVVQADGSIINTKNGRSAKDIFDQRGNRQAASTVASNTKPSISNSGLVRPGLTPKKVIKNNAPNTGGYDPFKPDNIVAEADAGNGTSSAATSSDGTREGNYETDANILINHDNQNQGQGQGLRYFSGLPGSNGGFGQLAYNPYNTYIDSVDERGRLFGPGLRRRKTTFTHGPSGGFDPQTGQPTQGGSGQSGYAQMYDTLGNPIGSPDNTSREAWIDKNMDPRFASYNKEGDMTSEMNAEMNAEYTRLNDEYNNSRARQATNRPNNTPIENDFKTKYKNWRQERGAQKDRRQDARNPNFESSVNPNYDSSRGNMNQQKEEQKKTDRWEKQNKKVQAGKNPYEDLPNLDNRIMQYGGDMPVFRQRGGASDYSPEELALMDQYMNAQNNANRAYNSNTGAGNKQQAWNVHQNLNNYAQENYPNLQKEFGLNTEYNNSDNLQQLQYRQGFRQDGGAIPYDLVMALGGAYSLPMHQTNGNVDNRGNYIHKMDNDANQMRKIDNTPNVPGLSMADSPYGNATGQSTMDEKLKFQMNPQEVVDWGLTAGNQIANIFDTKNMMANKQKAEDYMTADALNPVYTQEDARLSEGFDQFGNNNPYLTGTATLNQGQGMMGSIGSPLYSKQGGAVNYKQGGEYEMDDAEMERLKALGYEFEILD